MKRFLLFSLIFLSPLFSFAQRNSFTKELLIGVGGGINVNSIDFLPHIAQSFNSGMQAGLSAKFISQKHLGLIAEVNFSQHGWKETFNTEQDFSYSRTLNYIDIPFMTHLYFGDTFRFFVNAGPQLGLLIGDKQNMSNSLSEDIAARQAANPDKKIGFQYAPISNMIRFDYGIVGGLGVELRTLLGNFDLEGRYYFGLSDIFTNKKTDANYFFARAAHRMIEARLTYYIKLR